MSAYTRFESERAMATSILPTGDLGRPFSPFFHVAPASRVTYTPLPGPPLNIAQVCISTCHMPATSTFGSCASMVRPEQPVLASANKERCHVSPPSVVLYT